MKLHCGASAHCPRTAPAPVKALLLGLVISLAPAAALAQCEDWGADADPAPWSFDMLPDGIIDMEMAGSTAWLARTFYGALVAVDMSDPEQPVVLGQKAVEIMNETYRVEVHGDLAFLTYIQWGSPAGVRIFDISDPADPLDVGDFVAPSGTWAYDMEARDNLLFVSFPGSRVGVLDVSNPAAPVLIGQVLVSDPYQLSLDGNLLYVRTSGPTRIVDVTDPTQPVIIASFTTTSLSTGVLASGGLAYITTQAGLEIFDVSDLGQPTPVGSWTTSKPAYWINVSGDLAYLMVRQTGVQVLDMRITAAPALVGLIPMPTVQWAPVYAYGDHVYVPSDPELWIAPRQCAFAPAPVELLPTRTDLRLETAPNPFNPQTVISFELPESASASLEIFDPAGRRVRVLVRGEALTAGAHSRGWDGRDEIGREAPSGTYVCRLRAGETTGSTRLTLLR
jgi:hypothetical protein